MDLRYGKVSETKAGFVRVELQDYGIVTKWLPVTMGQTYGTQRLYQLAVNTFVACLLDGNAEEGVCLGGIYNALQPAPDVITEGVIFSDGTKVNYDPQSKEMEIVCQSIKITGDITVTGDVTAMGVSLVNHKHTGVSTGPGVSGPPLPQPPTP